MRVASICFQFKNFQFLRIIHVHMLMKALINEQFVYSRTVRWRSVQHLLQTFGPLYFLIFVLRLQQDGASLQLLYAHQVTLLLACGAQETL